MERKEKYRNVNAKTLDELQEYLRKIISIDNDTSLQFASKAIEQMHFTDERVWALFGEKCGKFICLQVGESIDIKNEIAENIRLMYGIDSKSMSVSKTNKNTQFYHNTYSLPDDKTKREFIYMKMKEDYSKLIFYALDVDNYLKIEEIEQCKPAIKSIVEFAKANYAETLFAYETQSIYWNVYRSGVGAKLLRQLNNRISTSK